jgi:hypothetical protein
VSIYMHVMLFVNLSTRITSVFSMSTLGVSVRIHVRKECALLWLLRSQIFPFRFLTFMLLGLLPSLKGGSFTCVQLIKHLAMTTYGAVEA